MSNQGSGAPRTRFICAVLAVFICIGCANVSGLTRNSDAGSWIRHNLNETETAVEKEFPSSRASPKTDGSFDEPDGSDVFFTINFTHYVWPFAGTTMGLGYAYNHDIVPGYLSPGFSVSASIHPKSFVKAVKGVAFFLALFADEDEREKNKDDIFENDDEDEDEESDDYPWRDDVTIKVFNEFRFAKIRLRPFFGRMFMGYSYKEFSDTSSTWIAGAELLYTTSSFMGLAPGLELAYIIPDNPVAYPGEHWLRCSMTLHL